jgi:nucleoside phosphorylase
LILSAGSIEKFDFAEDIGIGTINSAITLTKISTQKKPDSLIFVGSAGSYGNHDIFDIVYSHKASNIENGFLEGRSYTPINNTIELEEFGKYKSNILVNSSNYITTDDMFSKQILEFGATLESMEFYSVASVAKEFNIPFLGIFVVTNFTNKNAHKDFTDNHKKAMKILTAHLKDRKIV